MTEQAKDLEGIRNTVDDYFLGMYHSDTDRLAKAFHSDTFLSGYFQGNFSRFSVTDWLEMVGKTEAPAEQGEAFDMNIVSIDMKENVAVVKVRDLYLGLWFTDYLTLIKMDDGWKIVNKSFHHEPKA
jgi:hypothetical protein